MMSAMVARAVAHRAACGISSRRRSFFVLVTRLAIALVLTVINVYFFFLNGIFISMALSKGVTVKELKSTLRSKGAKLSGNKGILTERLRTWNENKLDRNLVKYTAIKSETCYPFPQGELFANIQSLDNKKLKYFTIDKLDLWFHPRGANASQTNGRKLFLSKFLKRVMFYIGNTTTDCDVYIKAYCAAEMRKNVDYECKLLINISKTASTRITQATCTCAAGKGWSAACKHIAALSYNVEQFAITGESFELISPTSEIQLWHKPPTPGRGLTPKTVIDMLNQPNKIILPQINRVWTASELSNQLINFGTPSPVLKGRIVNATAYLNDHNYLPNMAFEIMKKRNELSKKTIAKIERETRQQRASKKWLSKRRFLITASVAFEMSRTVKTGNFAPGVAQRQLTSRNLSRVPSIQWGIAHEKEALEEYATLTHQKIKTTGLFIHKDINFLAASPDGMSFDNEIVVEVKCPYSCRDESPTRAQFLSRKGNTIFLKRNHKFFYQCQMQMFVTGCKRCDFVVWTRVGVFIENITFNDKFCQKLVKNLERYYQRVFAPLCLETLWS